MKNKILFFLLLFIPFFIQAQSFSTPIGHSKWYDFSLYAQHAYVPNTVLNRDKQVIDSTMHSLIVNVIPTQFVIIDSTFHISNLSNGEHSFNSTATKDSVYVDSTFSATDMVFLQPKGTSYNINDLLFIEKHSHYFLVHRNSSGTSGLTYQWYWIKRY